MHHIFKLCFNQLEHLHLDCALYPIDYPFPDRSMQQVYSKLHTEAAPLKNACIWSIRISPHSVALPQLSIARAVTVGGRLVWQRWNGRGCCYAVSDGMDEDAV